MKILVFPRDQNPYQELLYGEMERLGARISYLGRLTPSRSCNLLLLPLELAARRLTGARLIHLHWVYGFSIPASRRFPMLRQVAQAWFAVWLRIARLLGMRLVWTAHNTLPHVPVFADDVAARRMLATASDLVFAHSQSALAELAALGAVPRRSSIIQHGPFDPAKPAGSLRIPGSGGGPRQFLFFGIIRRYKGAEDLLAAFARLPSDVSARLTIAGECGDPGLRSRLVALAQQIGERVTLRLDHVPDDGVAALMAAADVVVLPFRQVTTSGSAVLALCHGRPLVVPDLAALAELPDDAVVRYDGTVAGLSAALGRMVDIDVAALATMSASARAYTDRTSWREIAVTTMREMISVLGETPDIPRDRALAAP